MRILFVAADAMEYRGILARVSDVRREHLPVDFARSARLGEHEVLLLANGAGGKRAAAAVCAGDVFAPEAIVSTGFCGALEDKLGIADVVAATAVAGNGREHRVEAVEAPHAGVVCTIDHVAQSAEEKRRLRESGASAVEMEAAAVADSARMRTIPFYCVRAVTDLAGESMANDFNQALRSDGHFDTIRILRGALSRPTIRFPELIRLRCRCVRAAEALGKFFVGCRF
jgi:adenosylhomocysteine nucleosidase